ncbi:MAG: hypothetical protein ACUVWR_12895 [Anaerolineae bacterium]
MSTAQNSYIVAKPYLDPSTGSYLLQLAIASLLGALFLLRSRWRALKSFGHRFFGTGKGER